jgi:cytochrome c-type biogenesis protein
MPPQPSRFSRQRLLAHGYLTPFAALALYGLLGWWGWQTGSLSLVQPRSYDAALPANACACLVLLGLAPIALGLGWVTTSIAWVKRHIRVVNIVGGVLLILVGLLLVTGLWNVLLFQFQAVIDGFVPAL